MPQSKKETELDLNPKSKEKKIKPLPPEKSRSKSKNRMNPNYQNKANTRANVKVSSSKPYNAYKNLVDISDVNESIVEETPVTTVSKVTPKPKKKPYKKFEELEIVKASKKVTKKKSNIIYDSNHVYGASSMAITKIKQKEEETDKNYNITNKITERDSEYHHSDEERFHNNKRSTLITEENEEPERIRKSNKKRRKQLNESHPDFEIENKNVYNAPRRYQNYEDNYGRESLQQAGLRNSQQYDNYNQDIRYAKEPFSDLKGQIIDKKNVRDSFASQNDQFMNQRVNQEDQRNPELIQPRDIYSCQYCEEVYKIIIFQNLPVKVFQCYYCHNMINSTSLDFYYKKYDQTLKQQTNPNDLTKSINENPIITPKDVKPDRNIQSKALEFSPQKISTEEELPKQVHKQKPEKRSSKQDNEIINIKPLYDPNESISIKKESKNSERDKLEEKQYEVKKQERVKTNILEHSVDNEARPRDIKKQERVKTNILEHSVDNEARPRDIKKQERVKTNILEHSVDNETRPKPSVDQKKQKSIPILKKVELDDNQKPVNFDRDWVKWNAAQNEERKEEYLKKKELIEINVSEDTELKGNSLAEAFKKKKGAMIKKFEKRDDVNTGNANENTTIEEKKNSKNITKNDLADETNCTKSGGDNTTIGEILNDSELRPINTTQKGLSDKKKKSYESKNIIPEENEPSKELMDRLIYGKKAEMNKKEMKDVNKRMYSKLVESKEKAQDEEKLKKKEEFMKNKEKLKQYADNLKNTVVKKQKA